jgi:5-carboxymethyl-2-hydroxymuconate isomerase
MEPHQSEIINYQKGNPMKNKNLIENLVFNVEMIKARAIDADRWCQAKDIQMVKAELYYLKAYLEHANQILEKLNSEK